MPFNAGAHTLFNMKSRVQIDDNIHQPVTPAGNNPLFEPSEMVNYTIKKALRPNRTIWRWKSSMDYRLSLTAQPDNPPHPMQRHDAY